jgi:hypothetical protein
MIHWMGADRFIAALPEPGSTVTLTWRSDRQR